MAEIRLAIEGEDAIAATEELLAIRGISGSYKVSSDAPEREGVVATVATIVGILGGEIAIAEQSRKWYQENKAKQSGKRKATVYAQVLKSHLKLGYVALALK